MGILLFLAVASAIVVILFLYWRKENDLRQRREKVMRQKLELMLRDLYKGTVNNNIVWNPFLINDDDQRSYWAYDGQCGFWRLTKESYKDFEMAYYCLAFYLSKTAMLEDFGMSSGKYYWEAQSDGGVLFNRSEPLIVQLWNEI